MNRYRLCYRKFGPARFASHLDLGRALGRALRRAGLPVAYSGGFHPLPKLGFGPPLPVGVEGAAEYVDVIFTKAVPEEEIAGCLNRSFPPGLAIVEVKKLPAETPALTAVINRLSYQFLLAVSAEWNERNAGALLQELWQKKELPVVRKKQGREKMVDLRPFWDGYNFSFVEQGLLRVEIEVTFGPLGTLRPDEFSTFFPAGWRVEKITRLRAWNAGNPGVSGPVHRR